MSEDRKAGERLLFKCVMILVGAFLAYLLLPEIWNKLSPFILAIPMAAMLQHPILFLEKKLKIKTGDSFCLHPTAPHHVENPGKRPAKVLWISTPPSF